MKNQKREKQKQLKEQNEKKDKEKLLKKQKLKELEEFSKLKRLIAPKNFLYLNKTNSNCNLENHILLNKSDDLSNNFKNSLNYSNNIFNNYTHSQPISPNTLNKSYDEELLK